MEASDKNLIQITLYTTFGCSLCEEVEGMLYYYINNEPIAKRFEFSKFDIIDDEAIMQRYRTEIPVLFAPDSKKELKFPFDYDQLKSWCEGLG